MNGCYCVRNFIDSLYHISERKALVSLLMDVVVEDLVLSAYVNGTGDVYGLSVDGSGDCDRRGRDGGRNRSRDWEW